MLPWAVASKWRSTPPPDGIANVWNFSVFGSNRTIVFGRTPDSLYQMMSPICVMAYGSESFPPGDGYSFTWPFFGSKRPSMPRGKSVYQITSSDVIVSRRGRASALGSGYSLISMVFGSTLPMRGPRKSTYQGTPFELRRMP